MGVSWGGSSGKLDKQTVKPKRKPYTVMLMVPVQVEALDGGHAVEQALREVDDLLAEYEVTPLMFYEGHGESGFVEMMDIN